MVSTLQGERIHYQVLVEARHERQPFAEPLYIVLVRVERKEEHEVIAQMLQPEERVFDHTVNELVEKK